MSTDRTPLSSSRSSNHTDRHPGRWRLLGILLTSLAIFVAEPAAAQCNSGATATPDTAAHNGGPVVINVLANDIEPDGEMMFVEVISEDCDGTAEESFGAVLFVPTRGISESCTITYEVTDEGGGAASESTITMTMTDLLFRDSFESGDLTTWVEQPAERSN